eukprot:Gb_21910 [translate_table: standard]
MKIGDMGISTISFCCWFLLLLLVSPVCCDNVRKLGPSKNVNELGNGEKQTMESSSLGRKFGTTNKSNIRKDLSSLMKFKEREKNNPLDIVAQRRLLEDNATKSVTSEGPATKNTEEIIPGKETFAEKTEEIIPEKETFEEKTEEIIPGKETFEEKTEEIIPGKETFEEKTQKLVKNQTSETREEKLAENQLIKEMDGIKAKNKTEQEMKLQLQAASPKLGMKAQEVTQNATNPEEVIMKETPNLKLISPNNDTLGVKADNIKGSEVEEGDIKENSTKVNVAEKQLHNRAEEINKDAGENSAGESAKDVKQIIKAETLENSTDINILKDQSIAAETVANSRENAVQKMDSNDAGTLTNLTDIGIQNSTSIRIQKVEGAEVKSLGNTTYIEMQKMKSTKEENLANSTDIQIQKIESIEAENVAKSTEMENQKPEIQIEGERLPNSADTEIEAMDSVEVENFANAMEIPKKESIEAENLPNSSDTERPKTVSTEAENLANSADVEIQSPEDEYSDLIQEFTDLPSKLQDTAEKVADQLMPGIQRSKKYFNLANEEITQGFRPLIGNQYAPFVASGVSCMFLLVPLVVAIVLFEQIRVFFPLQKLILLANIYLANYFATLTVASFVIGMEPMEFFYRNSISGYVYLQLLQGLGYLLYLLLQCFNVFSSCSNGPILSKLASVVQCSVSLGVGLHYYVTVFHRAMAQKAPRTCWRVHGIYTLIFFILCLFSKIKHGKKEYLQAADCNTNKKN